MINVSEKTPTKLSFELLVDNTEVNFWLYDTITQDLMLNDSDESRLSDAVISILNELYGVEVEYVGVVVVTQNQIISSGYTPISWE